MRSWPSLCETGNLLVHRGNNNLESVLGCKVSYSFRRKYRTGHITYRDEAQN